MKFLPRIQMERDRLGVSFLQPQEITGIPVQLYVEKLSFQVHNSEKIPAVAKLKKKFQNPK